MLPIFQPLFTVSGQQDNIRTISEGEYKDIRGKFDKNGVRIVLNCKTCLKQPLTERQNKGLQDRLSQNAGQKYCRMLPEHSAILLTCIQRYSVLKNNFWSTFGWLLKTGFTVM